MTIERLTPTPEIPQDRAVLGQNERLNRYLRDVVNDLQREKLVDIHQRINLILDTQDDNIAYFGLKDATGAYSDGAWRLNGSSTTELVIQVKLSDVWTTVFTIDLLGSNTIANIAVFNDSVVVHDNEVIVV